MRCGRPCWRRRHRKDKAHRAHLRRRGAGTPGALEAGPGLHGASMERRRAVAPLAPADDPAARLSLQCSLCQPCPAPGPAPWVWSPDLVPPGAAACADFGPVWSVMTGPAVGGVSSRMLAPPRSQIVRVGVVGAEGRSGCGAGWSCSRRSGGTTAGGRGGCRSGSSRPGTRCTAAHGAASVGACGAAAGDRSVGDHCEWLVAGGCVGAAKAAPHRPAGVAAPGG